MLIIVLFTLVTIAVGNMVTMSSFSTSLSSNITIGDMKYTDNIRSDVIALMLIVLALILTALYFIVPMPLEKVKNTPEMIMQKVSDAVREFEGEQAQYDDCTMLCLVMK